MTQLPPSGPDAAPPAAEAADALTNGSGGAAILAAGIGCGALGVLALAADASPALNHLMSVYRPSGALSGVSTSAVLIWLAAWWGLERRWSARTVDLRRITLVAFALLGVSLLLTFPPVMDLLQGK